MTGQQLDMLTSDGKPLPRVDHRLDAAERPRLAQQALDVLARLRTGPASNGELSRIASRFSARICELRAAGYRIEIVARDRASGRCVYELRK